MADPISSKPINIASNTVPAQPQDKNGTGFGAYLADATPKAEEAKKIEIPVPAAKANADAVSSYMQQLKEISANQQF